MSFAQIIHSPFDEDWSRFSQIFSQAGLHLCYFYDLEQIHIPHNTILTYTNQLGYEQGLEPFNLEQLGIAFIWLLVGNAIGLLAAVYEWRGSLAPRFARIGSMSFLYAKIGLLSVALFVTRMPWQIYEKATLKRDKLKSAVKAKQSKKGE